MKLTVKKFIGIAAATAVLIPLSAPHVAVVQAVDASDGLVRISKSVGLPSGVTQPGIANTVGGSGEQFRYFLAWSCTTNNPPAASCDDVVITDVIPATLEVVGSYPSNYTFTPALPNPSGATNVSINVGDVPNGSGAIVELVVRFRNDTSLATGDTVTALNTASIVATINGESADHTSETVSVTGVVRPLGGVTADKTLTPSTVGEFTNATIDVALAGSNTGTIPGTLTLTDEASAFFGVVELMSVPSSTGTVETLQGGVWSPLALPFVGPLTVDGIRGTFTGVSPGESRSLPFTVRLRSGDIVSGNSQVFANAMTAAVAYPSNPTLNSDAGDAANLTVTGVVLNTPTLQKTFSPASVTVGSSTPITVSLTSNNSGQGGLSSVRILDPVPGGDNPFIGFLDITGINVVWPTSDADQQATLATNCGSTVITYPTTAFTLPGGCTPATLTSVDVEFERTSGAYPSNAAPRVNIVSVLEPTAVPPAAQNDARTIVTSALGGYTEQDDATDEILSITNPSYSVITNKTFARPATVGPNNSVALRSTTSPTPGDAPVDTLVIQDGSTLPTVNGGLDFWDSYDIRTIREVDCPNNYELSIELHNGTAWVPVTQAAASDPTDACTWTIPHLLTPAEQATAGSIRFTYRNISGQIPPNTTFQPEFGISYRTVNRETGAAQPLPIAGQPDLVSAGNCSRADVLVAGTVRASDELVGGECPSVTQTPRPVGGGVGVSKILRGRGVDQTPAGREGSRRQMDVTIGASLSPGVELDNLTIQDPIDPELTPAVGTYAYYSHVFASVTDIVSVGPFSVPVHEQATLQFFNGTSWVTAATAVGPASIPVTAGIPAYSAWRIVITEDPANPGIDPGLEQNGFDRSVAVVYQLRDFFRSAIGPHAAGDPVLNNICYGHSSIPMTEDLVSGAPTGTCDLQIPPFTGPTFNGAGNPTDGGWLHNNAQAVGTVAGAVTENSFDGQVSTESEFRILNGVLNGTISKSFTPNNQVPLPVSGVAPGTAQQRTLVLVGRNTSPGNPGVVADELALVDNDADFWDNFEFISATAALGGATAVVFDVDFGATVVTGMTPAALAGLSPATKATIEGVTARFANVPTYQGTTATQVSVSYVVRLRASSTNVATYFNTATIVMSDITSTTPFTVDTTSPIVVRDRQYGVRATKTVALVGPNAIDLRPTLNVTIRATNSGELNLTSLTAEDDDVFNAGDYASPSVPAALPANTPDFWPNVTFGSVTGVLAPSGATSAIVEYFDGTSWVGVGTYAVPAGFTATNINADLPADLTVVRGVRVRFTSAAGLPPTAVGGINFQVRVNTTATPNVALRNCSEAGLDTGDYQEYQNPSCVAFTPQLGIQSVDVRKVSTNTVVNAGTPERFTLTITNNGQQALGLRNTSPLTIVDTLPTHLLYDFGSANIVATFPTSGGTSNLPSTLPAVTLVGQELRWVFAPGQYLGSGETITIAITLEVAPAVAAGTLITNRVGVTMPSGGGCTSPDTYELGRCTSSVSINTISGGAIRATKQIDGAGENALAAGGNCPTPTGFVGTPCVAVTASGSTYTWRLALQNSGNTNLTNAVLIDRLPALNDTGSFAPFQRGTEWRGTPTTPPVVSAPGLATAPELQYLPASASASAATCINELSTGTACAAWVLVSAAPGGVIPADAIAVRLAAPYGIDTNPTFQPGDTITVEWSEVAPLSLTSASDTRNAAGGATPDGRLIQWNSYGYRVIGGTSVLLNESNKAGAMFDTAGLQITKLVDENTVIDPLDFGDFTVEVTCSLPDDSTFTQTVVVAHNESQTILGLPTGTFCDLVEQNAPADFTWVPDEDPSADGAQITVDPETPFGTVSAVLTNIFGDGAMLLIEKEVRGDPGTDELYGFAVECTFNGEPITLNAGDESFQHGIGDGYEVLQLPSGANCTVTENDNGTADYTDIEVNADGTVSTGARGADGATIDVADILDTSITIVTVTNTYLADIEVVKTVVEDTVAPVEAFGPFAYEVTCTNADESTETVQVTDVYSGDSFGWTGALELLAGAECTVTETATGNAQTVTINGTVFEAGAEPSLTVGPIPQGTARFDVENAFDPVAISVDKGVRGSVTPAPEFEFATECMYNDIDISEFITNAEFVLADGAAQDLVGLPVGTSCTIAEVDAAGADYTDVALGDADAERFDTASGVEPVAEIASVEGGEVVHFVNTFLATISIVKAVDNQTVLPGPFGPFTVDVTCVSEDEASETVTLAVSDGETVEWTGTELLAGTLCMVAETSSGSAHAIAIDGVGVVEGVNVPVGPLPQGNTDTVVTNTYLAGSLDVRKEVLGIPTNGSFAFPFTIACQWNETAVPMGSAAAFTLVGGATRSVTGLPIGATCNVAETDTGNAVSTRISVNGAAATVGTTATVSIAVAPANVLVSNDFVAVNPPGGGGGGLPGTGSDVGRMLWMAMGLLAGGLGAWLVVARSRRRADA